MRILISNDDGINAPGIAILEQIARELSDDVWVVAPETDQSGVSHSLTIHNPLRVRKIADKRYGVSGTPTDCVLIATRRLMHETAPDLVLSGVNRGANLAEDVHYSGTIAAAKEATLLGLQAIAMSQVFVDPQDVPWRTARAHGPALVEKLIATKWPRGVLVNVNYPPVEPEAVTGVEVVSQGQRVLGEMIVEGRDPRGVPYYWIGGLRRDGHETEGTDLSVIRKGAISVTPLHIDLTARDYMGALEDVLGA